MRIESFSVQGFANLVQEVTLEPLDEITVLYGPNNAGKSNLVRAFELYFRLLGAGEAVTRSQVQLLERGEGALSDLLKSAFNRTDPQPILFTVRWSLTPDDLQGSGIHSEQPCRSVMTQFQVQMLNRTTELKILQFCLDDRDVSTLERSKEPALLGFAGQLRRFLADARPFRFELPVLPYARLGDDPIGFPQSVRDALFDARQSVTSEDRRRWALFHQQAGALRVELGDGSWDTAFDRQTGKAEIMFLRGEEAVTLESMGSGVRRMAYLLAELVLAREGFVCLEEPEWRLSPEMQVRLMHLVKRVLQSGLGTRQLLVTTHSPAIAGQANAFQVSLRDGIPVVERKPWDLAAEFGIQPLLLPGEAQDNSGLNQLIGLVEELAEMDPDAIFLEDEFSESQGVLA